MKRLFTAFYLVLLMIQLPASAQQYTVNGSASQDDCHTYTLTKNLNTQSGSVWNNFKIDLTQSFDFTFDVYLGQLETNVEGADGITFVLQPVSTSIGSSGGGLGFQNIAPSIGVTLDTYQNSSPDNDPSYDHIAIQRNGDLNHSSSNNLAGFVPISATSNNVEDGNWHTLKVIWNATTKTLEAYFDGVLRVSVVNDIVNTTFGGNPLVFWGFTGSTGGLRNLQRFKTALSPGIKSLATQNRCINEPITFYDSTISFAPVIKRYWDFGDFSPIDSVNINPVHTYAAAGDYTVTLRVIGADGCEETQTQPVRIGSKPVAAFTYNDSCVLNTIQFTDASAAAVGSINNWYWDLGNGSNSTVQNPSTSYSTYGFQTIKLAVKSAEGCLSDTLVRPIYIHARPVADFTFTDSVCLGTVTSFFDNSTLVDGPITGWSWIFPDTAFPVHTKDAAHVFLNPGNNIVFHAVGNAGNCLSIVQKNVFVVDKPRAYFKNGPVCQLTPVTLQDSSYTTDGTAVQQWWWQLGNGQFSGLQNPSPIYNIAGPDTIKLVVRNSRGCVSDTFTKVITVGEKPLAKPGYAVPLCSNKAHQFLDSSVVSNGSITAWQWLFSNGGGSTQQNPLQSFGAGPNSLQLIVTSNAGCKSDTAYRNFITSSKPGIAFTAGNGCVKDTIRFAATSTSNINAWIWNYGDGVVGSTQNTSYVYALAGTYPVTLFAKDGAGCYSDTLKRDIIISGTNANAGIDVLVAPGQPVQLQAGGGITYTWSPAAGLSDPNIANPVATNFQDRTYTVTASTPQGCSSTDQVAIFVYKGPDIYVPSAFSPNGDNRNDLFRAIPVGISKFESLSVFNRYGQKIFFTSNAQFGWDGTWQSQKQPQGVYVWMVSGVDFKGERIFKKGTVMLVR
jgi:gliding motility-associated-like protein